MITRFDSSEFDTKLAELRRHASSGSYQLASSEIEAMLSATPPEERLQRAKGLALLAECYPRIGDLPASVRCATEAVGLAERLGEHGLMTDALTCLSFVYGLLNLGRDALDAGLRALAQARRQGDPLREAWALNRVGVAYSGLENPVQACNSTEQALDIAQAIHADDIEFSCLNNLAYYWLRRAEDAQILGEAQALTEALEKARSTASLACTLARGSGSPYQVAVAVSNLVDALLLAARPQEAWPLLEEFASLSREHGYQTLAWEAEVQQAVHLRLTGAPTEALERLKQLLSRSASPRPKLLRATLQALCATHKQLGQHREALETLEQILRLQRRSHHDTLQVETEVLLIRDQVEAAQSRADSALAELERERQQAQHLEREQRELHEHVLALDRAAHEDVLTGLHNRRHAEQALPLLVEQARQRGDLVSVAVIDVDHFKKINDTYGHAVGDAVLTQLAQLLRYRLSEADLLARMGGEEFVAVMVGGSLVQATDLCERLRLAVAAHAWHQLAEGLVVRVSIGLAGGHAPERAADLLARADRALYAAKRAGRNRLRTEATS